ncbi:MAG: YHS domain-containing protein [candidate division Zixibacteria bacterium]|nr:YHS domain-containing protein [candidate division Zixibacteria bacterium]
MRKTVKIFLILTFAVSALIITACDETTENKPAQEVKQKTAPTTETQTQTQPQKTLPPPKFQQAQMRDAFSGKLIDKNVYTDYQGKRVYFCCTKSLETFRADPNKYLDEFDRQGVILADAPKRK